MQHDAENTKQPYVPLQDGKVNTFRYRSPLSFPERLNLEIQRRLHSLIPTVQHTLGINPRYPVSPDWQRIINYLYREEIIEHPYVIFDHKFNDEVKMESTQFIAKSVTEKTDGHNPDGKVYAVGTSTHDLNEAISKAIGEQLERYTLLLYRNKDLLRTSIKCLKEKRGHFLDPHTIAGASNEQKKKFPERNFNEESTFQWLEGCSLTARKKSLIPAQLVFWNYCWAANEPRLQQPITNGAAGMFTLEEAILSGLYELIQRDSFLLFWLNKIAPPRIDLDSIKNEEITKLVNQIHRYSFNIEILDITSDLKIPVFAAVLLDSRHAPAVSVSAGCDPDPEKAILSSLSEVLRVYHWVRGISEKESLPFLHDSYEPFSEPLGRKERLTLWGNPLMRKNIEFFIKGPRISLDERRKEYCTMSSLPGEQLSFIKDAFRKLGDEYEIFFYEAKHPVLKTLGYHSVRAIVPALLPLYLNETWAPLGGKRLREAIKKMGYAPAEKVNSFPHPFP